MKVDDIPPFISVVSSNDQEYDECSELTESFEGDQISQNEEGDFARIMAMMDPSQFDPTSLSGNKDLIRVNAVPLNAHKEHREKSELKREKLTEQQGLLDLRLQLAKQSKMLNLLSAKLNKSQLENQTLKVEKSSLIHELAQAREEAESAPPHGRFSLRGGIAGPTAGGSMQMLLNTNARLRTDNDRLRASLDRVSASTNRAEEDVEKLRQENEMLRKLIPRSARKDSAGSEDTSETSLTSGTASDENQDQDVAIADFGSRLPSMKQGGMNTSFFCSDPAQEDEFDFSGGEEYPEGDASKDNHRGTGDKEMNTVGDKVTTCNEFEGLLVDFVEGRKSRGATRWWPSLRDFKD